MVFSARTMCGVVWWLHNAIIICWCNSCRRFTFCVRAEPQALHPKRNQIYMFIHRMYRNSKTNQIHSIGPPMGEQRFIFARRTRNNAKRGKCYKRIIIRSLLALPRTIERVYLLRLYIILGRLTDHFIFFIILAHSIQKHLFTATIKWMKHIRPSDYLLIELR